MPYVGFANHIQYLEQFRRYAHQYFQLARDASFPGTPVDKSSMVALSILNDRARDIASQRVVVDRENTKLRLFKLGGEIVAMVRQSGPEWLQMRQSLFRRLLSITGTNVLLVSEEKIYPLWDAFATNSEREDLKPIQEARSFRPSANAPFATDWFAPPSQFSGHYNDDRIARLGLGRGRRDLPHTPQIF